MLKNLFSNRLFIGALAFFILCVVGSLLYQQHVYKETDKALTETKAFQQWWKARQATPPSDATETPKSEAVEAVASRVNDPSVDEAENENVHDFASYSSEELQQIYDQFYTERGLKPPPKGYDYRWARKNVPLLDENGNPILHKIGEPIVELEIRVGFAPTREEYERYDRLVIEEARARQEGQVAKANEILAEIEQLTADVQRERPFVKRSTRLVSREEYEKDPNKRERVTKETLDAALREYGLEHLILP